jgi:DNA-binding NtrC family response regulator
MLTKMILLHNQEEPMNSLKRVLEKRPVQIIRARGCAEALRILAQDNPPSVVFTDLSVSDGSWADALCLTHRAISPLNLIVVSPLLDIPLYIAAMESGAFDFMVPPFEEADVECVLRRALYDLPRRRDVPERLAAGAAMEL